MKQKIGLDGLEQHPGRQTAAPSTPVKDKPEPPSAANKGQHTPGDENLKVVYLKSELKSFSWNDGLFAVKKEVDGMLHLWKIKDGKLDRYDSGGPNICCTGVNNKGVYSTDLTTAAPTLLKDNEALKEQVRVLREALIELAKVATLTTKDIVAFEGADRLDKAIDKATEVLDKTM